MSRAIFKNNATSTLAGSITNVATTASLSAGTGALFPNPTTADGDYFVLTFTDQATGLLNEIVHVTARSGDVITMTRAQEGTTALAWSAGDLATMLITAGTAGVFMQAFDQATAAGIYLADNGAVANVIDVTFPPYLTSLVDGMLLRVKVGAANTSDVLIDISGGVSSASLSVLNPDGSELAAGQLVSGGMCVLAWNDSSSRFDLQSVTGRPAQPHGSTLISSGASNFVVPASVYSIDVEMWAAGGSGGASASTVAASGGGGGEYILVKNLAVTPGQTIAYSIGAGGAASTAGANGSAGGNTTFSTYTANGGAGGTGSSAGSQIGGAGGTGGSGTQVIAGGSGDAGSTATVANGGRGGEAPRGGAGGNVSAATPGAGKTPGGGGGGGGAGGATNGAAGAAGAILITY